VEQFAKQLECAWSRLRFTPTNLLSAAAAAVRRIAFPRQASSGSIIGRGDPDQREMSTRDSKANYRQATTTAAAETNENGGLDY